MGKTAVFVMSTLQQIEIDEKATEKKVDTLVLCHARELAYQIAKEFTRFSKYIPEVKVTIFILLEKSAKIYNYFNIVRDLSICIMCPENFALYS